MKYVYKGSAFVLTASTVLMWPVQSVLADTFLTLPDTSLRSRDCIPAVPVPSSESCNVEVSNKPALLEAESEENASAMPKPAASVMSFGLQAAPTGIPAPKNPHKHYVRNLLIVLGIGIGLPLLLLVTTDK